MANESKLYIGRYCSACGKRHEKGAASCPFCGVQIGAERFAGVNRTGAAGIGYSSRTHDPVFAVKKRKYRKYVLIFVPAFSVLLALILIIAGVNPGLSALIGLILTAIILPFSLLSFRQKSSWEGTVVGKKRTSYGDHRRRHKYIIRFETKDGRRKSQKWGVYPPLFDYLSEGDRVRYDGEIGGAYAFEKYDKSRDDAVPCVSCGYLQDARQAYCTACGCPLMKGNPIV